MAYGFPRYPQYIIYHFHSKPTELPPYLLLHLMKPTERRCVLELHFVKQRICSASPSSCLETKQGTSPLCTCWLLKTELCTPGSSHHGTGSLCLPQGEGWGEDQLIQSWRDPVVSTKRMLSPAQPGWPQELLCGPQPDHGLTRAVHASCVYALLALALRKACHTSHRVNKIAISGSTT